MTTTTNRRQDNTGYDKQRVVAAALDALAPRAVAVARTPREAPDRCPRCNGSVVADRDVDGYLEAYCVACAWRAGALTAEQADALRDEIDAREIGPGRKRTRRGRQANGVKL